VRNCMRCRNDARRRLEERRRVFPDLKVPKPPQPIVKTYICRARNLSYRLRHAEHCHFAHPVRHVPHHCGLTPPVALFLIAIGHPYAGRWYDWFDSRSAELMEEARRLDAAQLTGRGQP
jgi:hypothetical protein